VVQAWRDAGATLVGKTITDELAFSLVGENHHYGTPLNSAAPDRIPGGSSSGSAAAVAGGVVDFALGTDTGGSVRGPAALCGLYGIRPTHGRLSAEGVVPMARSLDVVGWFTRDAGLLARVGAVLFGEGPARADPPARAVRLEDAFDVADPAVVGALAPALAAAQAVLGPLASDRLTDDGFADWLDAFRIIQGVEAWRDHGPWIEATQPHFGPGVAERFSWIATLNPEIYPAAAAARAGVHSRLEPFWRAGTVFVLPTMPTIAPLKGSDGDSLVAFREKARGPLCVSGLGGFPQVTLPAGRVDGAPVGLSLLGPHGADMRLLALAEAIATRLAAA